MPFLYEVAPIEIPAAKAPKLSAKTEQQDSLYALGLLLDSEGVNVHCLDLGSYSTDDFDTFRSPLVQPPIVAGRMLVSANTVFYLPNEEGCLGDITEQRDATTHAQPGIVVGQDTDVLVIAQRQVANHRYAVTAALSIDDLVQSQTDELTVRYGAY